MATSTDIRQVAVLGATGSIGASALDVIARHPGRMRASVLAAGRQVDALLALCARHRPDHAVIADPDAYPALRDGLGHLWAQGVCQAHQAEPLQCKFVLGFWPGLFFGVLRLGHPQHAQATGCQAGGLDADRCTLGVGQMA